MDSEWVLSQDAAPNPPGGAPSSGPAEVRLRFRYAWRANQAPMPTPRRE